MPFRSGSDYFLSAVPPKIIIKPADCLINYILKKVRGFPSSDFFDKTVQTTYFLLPAYLLFSMNLCKTAAISALVALSCGFNAVSDLPFIRPLPTA